MKNMMIVLSIIVLTASLISMEKNVPQAERKVTPTTKPLITFVELGSVNCIPCRQMQPVMKEIEEKYAGKVEVIFYDVNKQRAKANEFYIKLIPTQVFLDERGKEFWRHEGFYPAKDISKIIDDKLAPHNQ
jgi:thioredoxin 1